MLATRFGFKNTPRLVSGIDKESDEKARDFYSSICEVVVSVETPEIAEVSELLENTVRLVNFELINEFIKLCGPVGINVKKVVTTASSKQYGFMQFRPGVGVDGRRIPVNPLYSSKWAKQNNLVSSTVKLAEKTNTEIHKYVADRALALTSRNNINVRVLLLGMAYQAGISDFREISVSSLREYLAKQGHAVEWVDPFVTSWKVTNPTKNLAGFDIALLAVNQPGLPISALQRNDIPIIACANSYLEQIGLLLL